MQLYSNQFLVPELIGLKLEQVSTVQSAMQTYTRAHVSLAHAVELFSIRVLSWIVIDVSEQI